MSEFDFTLWMDDGSFESALDIPKGNDPKQNAWLTITVRYRLNFVDGWNDKAGVIAEGKDGGYVALDADGKPFPFLPWDPASTMKFKNVFPRGENIWNYRFLLITPQNYDGLDYETVHWKVRPNVLCLFRLVPADRKPPHITIDVVRLDPSDARRFRSHKTLYNNLDLYTPVFGHELGHALGLDHIKVMRGDKQCLADPNAHRCYGETPEEKANIMGSGTQITLICARPWLKRIVQHTEDDPKHPRHPTGEWTATLDTSTPPRKIPLGVALVGEPALW